MNCYRDISIIPPGLLLKVQSPSSGTSLATMKFMDQSPVSFLAPLTVVGTMDGRDPSRRLRNSGMGCGEYWRGMPVMA